MRWPSRNQTPASKGDRKPTGRSPSYRRCRPPITGSRSPTAANPEASTSSDRIRSTCSWAGSCSPAPVISTTSSPPSSRTHAPTAFAPPSGTNARCRCPVAASAACGSGVKPSAKRFDAASENGPRGSDDARAHPSVEAQPRAATADRPGPGSVAGLHRRATDRARDRMVREQALPRADENLVERAPATLALGLGATSARRRAPPRRLLPPDERRRARTRCRSRAGRS